MLKRIRAIYGRGKHTLDALWAWAKKASSPRGQLKRWRALQRWAKQKKDNATRAGVKDMWRIRFRTYRKRARSKLEWLKEHEKDNDVPPGPAGPMAGTTMFDGRVVPDWFIPKLREIRARGRWTGFVISGVRTPEYSEQLCRNMCGQPTCPGRCAGRFSNHNATAPVTFGEGAIDVTDYFVFASEARAVSAPFHNALPADRVHFSRSGR